MKCLVYITHKMDSDRYRYLSYLMKEIEGVMDLLVLYDQGSHTIMPTDYPDIETPYTRVIEHKHFETFGDAAEQNPKTVITREYPTEYKQGMEAYYPINDEENNKLYLKYKALADMETDVIFGGRLAEYRYYDMAPVIESAMEKWKNCSNC